MFGSQVLEIVIGLFFIYLLFSTLVTLINEYVSAILGIRSRNLKKIICRVLDDDHQSRLSEQFFSHRLIRNLAPKKGSLPSYISSEKFAKVVIDIIRTGGDQDKLGKDSVLDKLKLSKAIEQLSDEVIHADTKGLLMSFAKEATEDIQAFGHHLESWFNEMVERGQGWFNRKIKIVTFIVSLVVSVALNVDTIRIYKQLSDDPEVRNALLKEATAYLGDTTKVAASFTPVSGNEEEMDSLLQVAQKKLLAFYSDELKVQTNAIAVGWDEEGKHYFKEFFGWSIVGWILSALAISLGAPFWFDILNKVIAIRSAGKSVEKPSPKLNKPEATSGAPAT